MPDEIVIPPAAPVIPPKPAPPEPVNILEPNDQEIARKKSARAEKSEKVDLTPLEKKLDELPGKFAEALKPISAVIPPTLTAENKSEKSFFETLGEMI